MPSPAPHAAAPQTALAAWMHQFATREEGMRAVIGQAVEAGGSGLAACHELLRCYWELLEGTLPEDGSVLGQGEFGRPLNREGDLLILSLASRATSKFHAVLELSRLGFGVEALALGRMLFETMVDLHWANANLPLALDRFEQHHRMEQWLQGQRDERYQHLFGNDSHSLPEPVEDPADLAELKKLYGNFGDKHWSGLNFRERIDAAAGLIDECEVLYFHRDLVVPIQNAMVHTTATSMCRSVGWDTLRSGSLELRYGPSPEGVTVALSPAHWCYQQVLKLVWREFEVTTRDQLDSLLARNEARMRQA